MKKFSDGNSNSLGTTLRKLVVSAAMLSVYLSSASTAFSYPGYDPPRKYYVSKNGDNSDGLSWATAWNEMDQIKWAQIDTRRRDSLIIDGGVGRTVYRKPMLVKGPDSDPAISISVSSEQGHSGQVLISPGKSVNAIEIISGSVALDGGRRSGLYLHGAKNGFSGNTGGPFGGSVKNVEISHCSEAGLSVVGNSYGNVLFSQLIVHDNATNVVSKANGSPGSPYLKKCWIYNTTYDTKADGVRIDGNLYQSPTPGVQLDTCVLGPGLRDGINNSATSSRPTVTNCLLINATRNNISSTSAVLQNVTSFLTRQNPSQLGHKALKLQAASYYHSADTLVKKTIVFGGGVEVPSIVPPPYPGGVERPFPITVEDNTQFRTTGNTTVLSATMENPRFVSPVGLLPDITPIPILMSLDFSLRPDSPALGTGSEVTSIRGLLKSFE